MKQHTTALLLCFLLTIACVSYKKNNDTTNKTIKVATVINVNPAYFTTANPTTKVKIVECTLSDGTKTKCLEIETTSTPVDHQMGPWCPDNISDEADAGGIWLKDGKVYDVDGEFIKNLAIFYNDTKWKMYDENGNVRITKTGQDCINAANPNVGEEYENFCVECLPAYITDVTQTFTIPITPVLLEKSVAFQGRGGGNRPPRGERPPHDKRPDGPPPHKKGGGIPSTRGIALNGVEFSAPAPVNAILSAYTIAPFDDAGGHINVHQGYHYHVATGKSYSISQKDNHAKLIGYAMDGHGIYQMLDAEGKAPTDLDECGGHYDAIRGYHYHVEEGQNNFINCLKGAYVVD